MNVRGGLPGKILVELAGVTYEVDSGGNAYEALHALADKVNEAVDEMRMADVPVEATVAHVPTGKSVAPRGDA